MNKSFMHRVPIVGLFVLFFLYGLAGTALAQTFGEIAGVAKDQTGAIIPGATVTATNMGTNAARITTTNEAGIYTFPNLVPGTYSVKVEMTGFQTVVRNNIELQVQQSARIDFAMQLGQRTDTVEVTSAAPLLSTSDATVGTVIENKRIVDLPLNGRNFLQLVALSPNVSYGFSTPGQADGRQGGHRASQNISVSGIRGTWNHYTLDGIENTDINFNLYILLPSVDALQEFKVQTGIYSAEFGRGAGQINVSTKSGTNAFHGSVYEFMRNSQFDAKPYDFLGTKPSKAPFRWNQYGFTAGGPVWIPKILNGKDRLFFMSNFEGFKQRQTNQATGVFPTNAMRGGDFSGLVDTAGNMIPIYDPLTVCGTGTQPACPVDSRGNKLVVRQPFAGNKIPTSRFDPVSVKLLEYWAVPNISNVAWGKINYETPLKNTIDKNQFTQRVDFNESTSSQWAGRFSWTSESTVTPGIRQSGTILDSVAKQWMVSNTRVLSNNKVNELRFGLNQFKNIIGQELGGIKNVVEDVGIPMKYPDPDTWGIPTMRDMIGMQGSIGNGTNGPFRIQDKIFQVMENFSWIKGKHSIKMGGEYRYDIYDQIGNEFGRPVFGYDGSYSRSQTLSSSGSATNVGGFSAADFLLGNMYRIDVSLNLAASNFRNSNFAAYVDDTWRITPKLTVNLGLRYEFFQPFRDELSNLVNLYVPYLPNPVTGPVADMNLHPTFIRTGNGDFYDGKDFRYVGVKTARDGRMGDRMINNDWNNWAPRIGIAYSPSAEWSFRSGVGIFYSAESANSRFDLVRGIAGKTALTQSVTIPYNYQNFLGGVSKPTQLSTPSLWGVSPDVGTSYSYMYLFNVQRTLGKSTALEVGYSGALHKKLQGLQNMNPAVPGTTTIATRRAFPEFSWLQVVQGNGFGSYNGLGIKLTQRFATGFTSLVSYTWSKGLDTVSAIRGNSTDIYPVNSLCLRCEYSYSAYNTPHRFVASVMYELPFGKGKKLANNLGGPGGAVVNQIIGGWQVGSIVTAQSGRPLNLTTGWDGTGQGLFGENRLVYVGGDPYLGKGQRSPDQWFNIKAFRNTNAGEFGNLARNALVGPSQFSWDFSAIKNFTIHEEQKLQFRFEAFNFPNHPVLGNPTLVWGSSTQTPAATFGQIRSTATSMRQLQFALKYIF